MPIEHREKEFFELTSKAMRFLEHAEELHSLVRDQPVFPMLRMWRYPTFEAWSSWTVFTDEPNGSLEKIAGVCEVTWQRPYDGNRLLANPLEGVKTRFSTEPSVGVRDAFLSQDDLFWLLQRCRFANEVVVKQRGIAIDGIECGFRTAI